MKSKTAAYLLWFSPTLLHLMALKVTRTNVPKELRIKWWDNPAGLKTRIREKFARLLAVTDMFIGTEPKFLGETIVIK